MALLVAGTTAHAQIGDMPLTTPTPAPTPVTVAWKIPSTQAVRLVGNSEQTVATVSIGAGNWIITGTVNGITEGQPSSTVFMAAGVVAEPNTLPWDGTEIIDGKDVVLRGNQPLGVTIPPTFVHLGIDPNIKLQVFVNIPMGNPPVVYWWGSLRAECVGGACMH